MVKIAYIYILTAYSLWCGIPVPLEQFERNTKMIWMQNQK